MLILSLVVFELFGLAVEEGAMLTASPASRNKRIFLDFRVSVRQTGMGMSGSCYEVVILVPWELKLQVRALGFDLELQLELEPQQELLLLLVAVLLLLPLLLFLQQQQFFRRVTVLEQLLTRILQRGGSRGRQPQISLGVRR